MQELVSPEEAGVSRGRLDRAGALLSDAVEAGFIPGFATAVYRRGHPVAVASGGTSDPADASTSVARETVFLIASVTKPIVCTGALLLLQDGRFALEQPVRELIPEFASGLKDDVRLIHLFTHTSGLYDQIPKSAELRHSQAPIQEFVQAVCRTDLLFPPGTRVSYQSMGILLIGEIVERCTGGRLRDFLRERLFEPLGMGKTVLGMPPGGMEGVALSLDAPFEPGSNDVGDDWNTVYWRDFGAPWGGLHSTVDDLSRYLAHVLGEIPGPLSPALRRAMTSDQIARMPGIPEADKLASRWGLGFALDSPWFGNLVSLGTFGHIGATGSLFWADPETRLSCVLLTNQPRLWRRPARGYELLGPRFSNAVAASVMEA